MYTFSYIYYIYLLLLITMNEEQRIQSHEIFSVWILEYI
jgi:hypothetical protein